MSIKDCIYTPYIVQLQWIRVEKETGMEENYPTFKELEENLAYQIDYTANFNKSFRREFQAQKLRNVVVQMNLLFFMLFILIRIFHNLN